MCTSTSQSGTRECKTFEAIVLAAASVQASDNHVLRLHASVEFTSSSPLRQGSHQVVERNRYGGVGGISQLYLVGSRQRSYLHCQRLNRNPCRAAQSHVSYPAHKQTVPRFVSLAVNRGLIPVRGATLLWPGHGLYSNRRLEEKNGCLGSGGSNEW